jgi:hypothetical protein
MELIDCSVVVCTHNPHEGRLRRTLDAVKGQTLDHSRWELLLIDNASDIPLSGTWDIGWHRNARVIREDTVGLTHARLTGIRQSVAPLICFVDDDNVLAPDYLECALEIARSRPHIGAFCGSIKGEFEVLPRRWLRPYIHGLAVSEITESAWANDRFGVRSMPCGAGMCVRREVATAYESGVATNRMRQLLDRQGQLLLSGGDNDLAWTAIDQGLGTGRFHRLHLVHVIPRSRLELKYLVELHAGFVVSAEILMASRCLPPAAHGGALCSLFRAMGFGRLGPWVWLRSCSMRRTARRMMGETGSSLVAFAHDSGRHQLGPNIPPQ